MGWLAGWLAGHATLVKQVIFVRPKKTLQRRDSESWFVIRYFTSHCELQGYVTPNESVCCRLRNDCLSADPHSPTNMVSVGSGYEIISK